MRAIIRWIWSFNLTIFEFHILDCLFDGLLRQHWAMHLNRWQFEIIGNVWIFYLQCVFNFHSLYKLCCIWTWGNRWTATKSLNYSIFTLKTAFSMVVPSSFSSIWSFMTSPQAGAPTNPVPTFFFDFSREPTLRGF